MSDTAGWRPSRCRPCTTCVTRPGIGATVVVVLHTQARQVSIAERRKPDPRNRPGFLRVDTVHQGQRDGQAGVFHINAVDTVIQWEVVGCVPTICERHLLPVLEAILHQFPFRILGFHCDNSGEFINHLVAELLNKLLIEFTKSRPYRTTDNALVESKNGAVIRKHIGHGLIPAEHAEAFQKFLCNPLQSYLNFHRPCGFATVLYGARGKRRRVYRADDYRTPYEKLTSLPKWERFSSPASPRNSWKVRPADARMWKRRAGCRTPRTLCSPSVVVASAVCRDERCVGFAGALPY